MSGQPHILVVDDNKEIRDLLVRFLQGSGFRTSAAEDAQAARASVKQDPVDLAVVDIMMPGEDGWSLTKSFHQDLDLPVIVLSARGDDEDRIKGLELGADDYLSKPVNPKELVARIQAVLRRSNHARKSELASRGRIKFASWTLDTSLRELTSKGGTVIPLSAGEFRLLIAFLERPHVALSRDQLLDITQGRAAEPFDRSIDNAVSRLRRKIEDDQKSPALIKTLWGGGYVFTANPTVD